MTLRSSPQTVTADLEGPLDRAVRRLFGESWGKAREWIAAGKVSVDGRTTVEPTHRVRAGEAIAVDARARRPRPAELDRDAIVYVDAHIVVVAKPPGISTVPYDERESDTLDARVRAWIERSQSLGRGSGGSRPNLGVVHRLDKETSGLVVFTRTWLAKQHLAAQFRKHAVERRYIAVAHGDVRSRTFHTWLVENRGDGLRGSARGTPPNGSREAITHVESLERLAGATLIACRLETGRTHQIRIHVSEAGHPLLGERVYIRHFAGPTLEAPRLLLHAADLGFEHPATGRMMRWSLPAPEDVTGVIQRLRRREAR
jgi:23S rRNA pseudouridine1911/1915/1917 synthase